MECVRDLVFVDYLFRGREYRITTLLQSSKTLSIEIEDKKTGEEWTGEFNSEYIEELTHKTGNFKRFDVFVSMLQTVLLENCDSLSVDLMTYKDLESLRHRKLGSGSITAGHNKTSSSARQNKRYLIMTYMTEFDKIHYPLPLTFDGRPDPAKLKETIRQLRAQIIQLRQGNPEANSDQSDDMKRLIRQLRADNEDLSSQIVALQSSGAGVDMKKELRALKSVVQGLEEELAQERSKHKKTSVRRSREFRSLSDEMEELKSAERTLKLRVKNLTNELAIYKRHRVQGLTTPHSSPRDPAWSRPPRARTSSSDRIPRSPRGSQDSMLNSGLSDTSEPRSLRSEPQRNRSRDRANGHYRSSSVPRFDPTSYVRDQQLKKSEIQNRKKRQIRTRLSAGSGDSGTDRSRDPSPSSSLRSGGSRGSNGAPCRRFPTVYRREVKSPLFRRPTPLNDSGSEDGGRKPRRGAKDPKPIGGRSKVSDAYLEQTDEISEIDRRLNVLQNFFQKYLHIE